jgi:membrane protein DedA with SNARE-associated domain
MEQDLWATVTAIIRSNQEFAAGFAFLASMGESIIGLSLVIPSSLILVAKSGLIGAGQLAFMPIFLAASAGAIVGDLIAYAIGIYLGPRLAGVWPLTKQPELLDRGRHFFSRWGVWSLFACRFIGPLRWLMPMLAGSCSMRFMPFMMANVASGVLWAAVMLVPGSFALGWMLGA